MEGSSQCEYWNLKDDIIHHFCLYIHVALNKWFTNVTNRDNVSYTKGILLGVDDNKSELFVQLNFIILTAKWYIFQNKYNIKDVHSVEVLSDLKQHLNAKKLIHINNRKSLVFNKVWYEIYENL
jgi:hypothetical protein